MKNIKLLKVIKLYTSGNNAMVNIESLGNLSTQLKVSQRDIRPLFENLFVNKYIDLSPIYHTDFDNPNMNIQTGSMVCITALGLDRITEYNRNLTELRLTQLIALFSLVISIVSLFI